MVTSSKVTQPCHDGDSPFHDQLLSSGLPVCPPLPHLPSFPTQKRSEALVPLMLALFSCLTRPLSGHSSHTQVSRRHQLGSGPEVQGPPPVLWAPSHATHIRLPTYRQTWTQSSPLIPSTRPRGPTAHTHSYTHIMSCTALRIPIVPVPSPHPSPHHSHLHGPSHVTLCMASRKFLANTTMIPSRPVGGSHCQGQHQPLI